MSNRRRRKRRRRFSLLPATTLGWGALLAALAIIIGGVALYIVRYAPTGEHMELTEFYDTKTADEAVVILDGQLYETQETDTYGKALVKNTDGTPRCYLEIGFLKGHLDNGYVYDKTEKILRYTTDTDVFSVNLGEFTYSGGREQLNLSYAPLLSENQTVYVEAEFAENFTDFSYVLTEGEPNRMVIETAGYEKSVAALKKDTGLRQFGGPKSKILKDAEKSEQVTVLENYGKWVKVLTTDGVLGCMQDKYLGEKETETVAARLPERNYQHLLMEETVCLGWHQMTSVAGNNTLGEALEGTQGVNVISPTWFYINDSTGGLADVASMDYVISCHNRGVKVWGLYSDFENPDISTSAVLNVTSSRDNLINNIIAKAVAYGLDGVNIDFEKVEPEAGDGFIEFIRELSIKCENNDLVLSVDNYVPTESRIAYMNYEEQGNYADYIIIMGYDEHHGGDTEAGSTASIPFVTDAVTTMCDLVDPSQIVLGMPFYARLWKTEDGELSSSVLQMRNIYPFLEQHAATPTWSDTYGQNYVEFTEDGAKYQLWIEDADSLSKKLSVMSDNHLAGGAFWKLTLEPPTIWDVIKQYM